ncbi:tyrosine-type recombinase/integrase [Polaribacter cellanae]|uniref:Tyrosine-type recombinase/integrase n=1 Tax=Polaribacter cellanae TaxID=2818493 RepID=A0A975H555_9FLAO|nr:site-specific integrase [Polaribacter cellanae]QTE21032.1 tyrosine-type recombinase/integrase [Polaribacter cellanae]QTE21040.1 tyrosine-type recombinase/integrase [Polaribacter cellanae]QTE21049.1 tyrosine-type recombinase/integrase [Polaribacter cellanae]
MSYKEYLQKEQHSTISIQRYVWRLTDYKNWCKNSNYNPQLIDYKTLLQYIKYLQAKNWKPESVNNQIRGIKYYYDYLIAKNIRIDNPAEDVKVKRTRIKVLANLLSTDELEDLYYSYETENINDFYFTATAKRNKVITGLIVYQALNNGTLAKLQVDDLQLYKGKIDVPSTKRSNPRTLLLKPWQVIELMEYINEYRPKIQQHIKLYNDTLFPLNTNQFNTILNSIIKKLKQINYKVENLQQLRASVITDWLTKHNIREVQQMCGHKYIGSTERYQQDNLENLQEAITKFHPIN